MSIVVQLVVVLAVLVGLVGLVVVIAVVLLTRDRLKQCLFARVGQQYIALTFTHSQYHSIIMFATKSLREEKIISTLIWSKKE